MNKRCNRSERFFCINLVLLLTVIFILRIHVTKYRNPFGHSSNKKTWLTEVPLSYTKTSFCRNLNNVASYCLASLVVSVIVLRRRMFFFFFRSVSFNFPGTAHIKKNTLSIRLISRPLNIEELSFFAHGVSSLSLGIRSEIQKWSFPDSRKWLPILFPGFDFLLFPGERESETNTSRKEG